MTTIAVMGLGYVGLPIVVEFGKHFRTIGIDISKSRVDMCRQGIDPSRELPDSEMHAAIHAEYTVNPQALSAADFVIVAVPTPVDDAHVPDFTALRRASSSIGKHMKKGVTVIYESTVYPGATEEICIPVLERESGMEWKKDFFVGYSPERINPGDRERTLPTVTKVVSGDTPQTLESVAQLYERVVKAGVYRCPCIKTAEACKVIENTQRDLNIALMNELAIIFGRMGIDTTEVLRAAGTKWNFLKFRPGLVGGHCIGVDPYYLTHKAERIGYNPHVITAGRRVNDGMGKYIADLTVKHMIACDCNIKGARVNILGFTFKENCADIRNTKVADVIRELRSYGVDVCVHDPHADPAGVMDEYGIRLSSWNELPRANAIVAAVAHREFAGLTAGDLQEKVMRGGCFVDVKSCFDPAMLAQAGIAVRRL